LLGDGEVAMDHSEATETAERNSHGRIGDGVHGRGEDRDVEADLVREAGLGRDLGREDVAAGGDQEDVVEGQAFFGELLLPGQPAALTRASVLEGVARYSSVAVRSGPIPTMPTRPPTLSSMRARRAATASNQPTRLGRPVVAPYSCARSRSSCASLPCSSVGNGPSPTAVEYAFTTPMTRVILRGGIPAPTDAPPASGFELVTYG